MACELFQGGSQARCLAVAGTLIPSIYERERYCRSEESPSCPTYRLYHLRGRPLPQEAYYALWMPPLPTSEQSPM
jgi:hypothetical protein